MSSSASIASLATPLLHDEAAKPDSCTVLRPRRGWQPLALGKLWQYRELMGFLAMRDIKVRYKQTALGALWAIIQPLVMMVVLSTFFGRVIDMEDKTGGVPYPIFLYAGLLPWTFFAAAVSASTHSMINHANMLRKVYFPRLVIPLSSVGAPLVDYVVAFAVLLGLMGWYQIIPTAQILLLPLLVLITIVASLGVGIGLSGLTVSYRDFRYVVPFMLNVWFFMTPVVWPVKIVSQQYRWLLRLNPMGGTIEAFRSAVLGHAIDWGALAISCCMALICLVLGLLYFNRAERRFADVV